MNWSFVIKNEKGEAFFIVPCKDSVAADRLRKEFLEICPDFDPHFATIGPLHTMQEALEFYIK